MNFEHALDWRAGAWAGLLAGVAEQLALALATASQGLSPWAASRMTAAIVLGPGVLAPPDAFSPGILLVAAAVHLALSTAYGVLVAALVGRSGWIEGLLTGAAFGLALWIANYFVIAPALFPWLAPVRGQPLTPALHVFFGAAAAAAYLGLRRSVDRRSGIERRHWNAAVARERRAPFERRGMLAA